jgi:putative transposase
MQSLGRVYVQYFNYRYRRTGMLWEGRYKAALLDTEEYLLTCYRYIELNPVRAGMVPGPADYRGSSYRCNVLGAADMLVSPHDRYLQLGEPAAQRCLAYRSLFENVLERGAVDTIREVTNKAWVPGNERFRLEIEDLLMRQAAPRSSGGDRKSAAFQVRRKIN